MTDVGLFSNPLWFYIRKFRRNFALGMFFLIITNIMDGIYPLLLASLIDKISNHVAPQELIQPIGIFFLTMAGLAASRYGWRVFFNSYHTHAAEDLRNRIMSHLIKLTPQFYQRNQLGELMSLLVNDVQSFRASIGGAVLVLVDGVVIILVILPLMIMMNPTWTWKTLIVLPLVPWMVKTLTQTIYQRSKWVQDSLSTLSGYAQESVTGIRVIKSFAIENERARGYEKLSLDYEKANISVAVVDALWAPVMYFGVASGTVILLFIGLDDVLTGAATLGTLVAFQRYISKMIWPVTALGMGLSQYKKGMAAFDRIKQVLCINPDVSFAAHDPSSTAGSPDANQSEFTGLDVNALTFLYPGTTEPALKNLNLHLRPGEKLGITGPVGSGKSTLLHLLLGLYPFTDGDIQVNGRNLFQWREEDLRHLFTLIPQDVFLFSESVTENVTYAMNTPSRPSTEKLAADEALQITEDILDRVQILDEMRGLPGGLATLLGERGINLSGGQKQRLALARGLVRPTALLLMDDVLSAVDYRTESRILRELADLRGGYIIVSHRIAALRSCDRILVLNRGTTEALGTFEQVKVASPFFRELCQIQDGEQ